MLCSAYSKTGVKEIWNKVGEYVAFTKKNGYFFHKRQQQNLRILDETIENGLKERFYNSEGMDQKLDSARQAILANKVSPYSAAENLLDTVS